VSPTGTNGKALTRQHRSEMDPRRSQYTTVKLMVLKRSPLERSAPRIIFRDDGSRNLGLILPVTSWRFPARRSVRHERHFSCWAWRNGFCSCARASAGKIPGYGLEPYVTKDGGPRRTGRKRRIKHLRRRASQSVDHNLNRRLLNNKTPLGYERGRSAALRSNPDSAQYRDTSGGSRERDLGPRIRRAIRRWRAIVRSRKHRH